MTVNELQTQCGFDTVCLPDSEREIDGVYIGDLLSWVMGRAQENNVWITIMSNINVIAVASLADVSCVVLCESVILDDEVKKTAEEKGINVLTTPLSAYDTAVLIHRIL